MNKLERDELIVEMANDIKWLKEGTVAHRQSHSTYLYYFITCFVACILSWFK